MNTLFFLLNALRRALTIETQAERDERFLALSVDHADLERRIAARARAYEEMCPVPTAR